MYIYNLASKYRKYKIILGIWSKRAIEQCLRSIDLCVHLENDENITRNESTMHLFKNLHLFLRVFVIRHYRDVIPDTCEFVRAQSITWVLNKGTNLPYLKTVTLTAFRVIFFALFEKFQV